MAASVKTPEPEPRDILSSYERALELVDHLKHWGVRTWVYAPGSRSAPLAYALETRRNMEDFDIHVRIDERAAAFTALGLSLASASFVEGDAHLPVDQQVPRTKAGHRAIGLITTSGSAPAHAYPAVLEASHSGVPLVVVSADRPAMLRGTGANQTTDQTQMFGSHVREFFDWQDETRLVECVENMGLHGQTRRIVAAALGALTNTPGPVHINAAFWEPLTPTDFERYAKEMLLPFEAARGTFYTHPVYDWPSTKDSQANTGHQHSNAVESDEWPDEATVVVAGTGAYSRAGDTGDVVGRLATERKWPIFAEVASGLRGHPNAVPAYSQVLSKDSYLLRDIRRVIVVGHPTLNRPTQGLLRDKETMSVDVVTQMGTWTDVWGAANRVFASAYDLPLAPLEKTRVPGAGVKAYRLSQWLKSGHDWVEHCISSGYGQHQVAQVIWEGTSGPLVLGASTVIRSFDTVAHGPGPSNVYSNRGLAGIDGNIATAWGIALESKQRVRLVVGDVTFAHDMSALMHGVHEQVPDLDVVVMDNGGGQIFGTLEHAQAPEHILQRYFATPQVLNIEHIARAVGADYERTSSLDELRAALGNGNKLSGVRVIHIDLC
ncbi:MAG: thiamine pyrophosphate-binding protein [Actinomycetaceae bacterium]|nr:thiamine pyrophosphate-binding protein [Actinomycetaceae bacterium]